MTVSQNITRVHVGHAPRPHNDNTWLACCLLQCRCITRSPHADQHPPSTCCGCQWRPARPRRQHKTTAAELRHRMSGCCRWVGHASPCMCPTMPSRLCAHFAGIALRTKKMRLSCCHC